MHFPAFWRKKRLLPSCWAMERKHQLPKRWINVVRNTAGRFDQSALRDVTAFNLAQLEERQSYISTGLCEPTRPAMKSIDDSLRPVFGDVPYHMSSAARVTFFETVYVGDVVHGWDGENQFVGKVQAHVRVGKASCSILQVWHCVRASDLHSTWDTSRPSLALVRTTDILCACVHCAKGDSVVVISSPRARLSP